MGDELRALAEELVVDGPGADVPEAVPGRVRVVGAVSRDVNGTPANRRLEVLDERDETDHRLVVLPSLAGKRGDEVPDDVEAAGSAVSQQAHVFEGGDPLRHQGQHVAGQGLDAGLDLVDPRADEHVEVGVLLVGLDLVGEGAVDSALDQHRQNGPREVGRHDGVTGPEPSNAVTIGDGSNGLDDLLR